MPTIQITSSNYNGQVAQITYYSLAAPNTPVNLGSHTIPYSREGSEVYGTYELNFTQYNKTCVVSISGQSTTTTTTTTTTASPSPISNVTASLFGGDQSGETVVLDWDGSSNFLYSVQFSTNNGTTWTTWGDVPSEGYPITLSAGTYRARVAAKVIPDGANPGDAYITTYSTPSSSFIIPFPAGKTLTVTNGVANGSGTSVLTQESPLNGLEFVVSDAGVLTVVRTNGVNSGTWIAGPQQAGFMYDDKDGIYVKLFSPGIGENVIAGTYYIINASYMNISIT